MTRNCGVKAVETSAANLENRVGVSALRGWDLAGVFPENEGVETRCKC